MKNYKLELCKEFIKMVFSEYKGVERNLFFRMAEDVGLYTPNTYGTEMSEALNEMITIETVTDKDGNFIYNAFRLNEAL